MTDSGNNSKSGKEKLKSDEPKQLNSKENAKIENSKILSPEKPQNEPQELNGKSKPKVSTAPDIDSKIKNKFKGLKNIYQDEEETISKILENATGVHQKAPEFTTPVKVSPLIKGARWILLFVGIFYGYTRQKYLAIREIPIREEELKQKLARKAALKAEKEKESERDIQTLTEIFLGPQSK